MGSGFMGGPSREGDRGLFITQRHHRIDAHGATRGNPTGQERNERQQRGYREIGKRITRAHADQHVGHGAGEGPSASEAEEQSGDDKSRALSEEKGEDLARACAEGHANAELLRALRGGVRNDAIDAYDCQKQAQQAHGRRERSTEAKNEISKRAAERLFHGLDLFNGGIRIESEDLALDFGYER